MAHSITETIGVDLGDRFSRFCVLDQASGEVLREGRVRTRPPDFERFFGGRRSARVVVEAGTHSPWASRVIGATCAESLVANPRQLGLIYRNARKSDRVDAELLARVGRLDPQLLSPIRHRGQEAQGHLVLIRTRAGLVAARTQLINSLRGQVKGVGERIPKQDSESIGLKTPVPASLEPFLRPLLCSIETLTAQIKVCNKRIDKLAEETYPESQVLTQITGVGNLTALTFMLTLEHPAHFSRSRDVPAFLGLVPKRDQSGSVDKPMRISKAGNGLARHLLVQCGHYILGPFGPPCDLRRHGERIAARGGKIARRKAVVAVARKLAVVLHSLWRSGEVYDPNRIESKE